MIQIRKIKGNLHLNYGTLGLFALLSFQNSTVKPVLLFPCRKLKCLQIQIGSLLEHP